MLFIFVWQESLITRKIKIVGRIRLEAGQRKRPARRAFVSVFVWLFVLGRVLVSAPEARSAEGDGRRQPPVSAAADLYQDCHIFLWTLLKTKVELV